jgi:HAE1 family hydrophobic/amphiphilic exporter-1
MDFLSRWSERPKRVLPVFMALVLGAVTYGSGIPPGYLPRSGTTYISVLIRYRGAFEREIERTLTVPLENGLAEVAGIIEIRSLSDREFCRIGLRFADGVSPDDAYLDVREAVHGLYSGFPEAVQRPVITKSDPRDRPVFVAAFDPSVSPEELKRRFESVPGAGEVETGGEIKKEILLRLDGEKAAEGGLSIFGVLGLVRNTNIVEGFGPEDGPPWVLDNRIGSPREFADLHLAPGLKLGEAARAGFSEVPRDSIARIDGRERLVLYVRRAGDANTLVLSRRLRALADSFPDSRVLYDLGSEISAALKELILALLFGVFLIVLLTVFFLRRPLLSAAVCLNIPFSVFLALAVLRAAGFDLDVTTLSGLAVGAGLAGDAGILYGEEFLSRDGSPRRALREVSAPIIYSSLTTIGVFCPLPFASPALAGAYGGLALAVTSCILASLGYVFFFMPAFLPRLVPLTPPKDPPPLPALCRRAIAALSRRRIYSAAALLAIGGAAAFAAADFTFRGTASHNGKGISFTVEYESGSTLARVFSSASPLEDVLRRIPGVDGVTAKYERERASFEVECREGALKKQITAEIRGARTGLAGGFIFFPEGGDGRDSFEIVLRGPENRELRETAAAFAGEIRRRTEGPEPPEIVFHFKDTLPSKTVRIDTETALRLGIEPARAAAALRWAMSAPTADKIILPEEELDLRLTVLKEQADSISAALSLALPGKDSKPVRIASFARAEERPESGRIYRTNRRRSASFSVLTRPNALEKAIRLAKALAACYPFPGEVTAEIAREKEREKKAAMESAISLILVFTFLAIILLFEFENLRVPGIILAQLPFCLAPPVLLLRLFGPDVTLPAVLGLVMTLGIGVNNSLLVFRREHRGDLSLELLAGTFAEKSRPIFTASLTTVGGVLPLLFTGGAETGVLLPLSLAIAAGTAASPVVLLLFIALVGGTSSKDCKGTYRGPAPLTGGLP